jgi:hypothetical protein
VGGSLHLLNVTTGAGRSDSIESTYTAEDAPGLGASPDYGVSHLYTAVDWRDYAERTGHGLAFQQVDAWVTQLIDAPSGLPTSVGSYIRVEITASGGRESWNDPVHAYFVRTAEGWRLVGFERQP